MKNNDNNIRMKGKEKASLLSAFSFLISKGFLLSAFSFLISKAFLLSAFCFLLSTSLYAATSEEKRLVDVNGDGNITTADAALIYSYILGTADAKVTIEQVDVNGDGKVNTADVVEVYVAMKGFVDVTSVTLNHSEVSMERGESLQLVATINPSNATFQALTWKSSATSVATVDANGEITANGVGTATITVTAANGVKATCVVTVKGFEGQGTDTNNDYDFGGRGANERRGEWGNLWSK